MSEPQYVEAMRAEIARLRAMLDIANENWKKDQDARDEALAQVAVLLKLLDNPYGHDARGHPYAITCSVCNFKTEARALLTHLERAERVGEAAQVCCDERSMGALFEHIARLRDTVTAWQEARDAH